MYSPCTITWSPTATGARGAMAQFVLHQQGQVARGQPDDELLMHAEAPRVREHLTTVAWR